MPTKYKRDCDWCGRYYKGYGARFCSTKCSEEERRAQHAKPDDLPDEPDEEIHFNEDGEEANIFVYASEKIKSPQDLLDKTGVDLREWEVTNSKVNTWQVPMKVDGAPTVIQCYYVSVSLRRTMSPAELIRTVQIKVRPKEFSQAPSGFFTSVHWGDRHFPYNDPRCDNILYQILDITSPGMTVDHGDTMDCEEISKYPKDPHNRVGLGDEIKGASRFFGQVHALTPDAEHIFLEGNHEERLKRLVWASADKRALGEVLTLPGVREALEWPSLLGIDELGWEFVPYPHHKLLWDRILLIHGNKVRKDSGMSARAEYDSYGKSGLSGHTHRRGAFHRTDYDGVHTWYEMGMLGSIRADYVAHANWQQGLMVVSWSEDRKEWGPAPVPIHDGVAYFRGMRLEG